MQKTAQLILYGGPEALNGLLLQNKVYKSVEGI
jgi:hypothetical protein